MVNCSDLTFLRIFSHVKAHQDDHSGYESLTQSAQLNCQMDYHAKQAIWESELNPDSPTRRFPLEPICVFLGKNKLTSDKGDALRFWVQKQLARSRFHTAGILYGQQFDSVDWEMVHEALNRVPRMLQIWACNVQASHEHRPNQRQPSMGARLMPSLPKLQSISGDLRAYPPLQPLRSSRDIDALD
jgi:hypothetical protein